jgi:hypothetical protein
VRSGGRDSRPLLGEIECCSTSASSDNRFRRFREAGYKYSYESRSRTSTSADVDAIKRVLDSYLMSVNAADTSLAREVFAERDGVSFIHPP